MPLAVSSPPANQRMGPFSAPGFSSTLSPQLSQDPTSVGTPALSPASQQALFHTTFPVANQAPSSLPVSLDSVGTPANQIGVSQAGVNTGFSGFSSSDVGRGSASVAQFNGAPLKEVNQERIEQITRPHTIQELSQTQEATLDNSRKHTEDLWVS